MTKGNAKQNAVLNDIIDYLTKGYGSRHEYEVKYLEVKDSSDYEDSLDWKDIHVSLCVGIKNDEGTMAAYLCRDHYDFFIGPRGGIFYYPKGSMNARRIKMRELHKISW